MFPHKYCHRLNVYVLLKFIGDPNVMVEADGVFCRSRGHEAGTLRNGIRAVKEAPESTLVPFHHVTQDTMAD